MNRQQLTPIFTRLKEHIQAQPVPFHIPGHKNGTGMDEEFREFIGSNILNMDLINIEPLDDLHHPSGVIDEAQKLAAEAFGADYTFFSVQGTSGAIMTMILSVCAPGDKILVPRNVHKSIMNAIIFSGAVPIFMYPALDEEFGISHGITPSTAQHALERHPDAKALLVINPTYFGFSSDLGAIVETAHQYDVPVLVDEAHGVHIHFHDSLPPSAMEAGADMAATSVHKLGGSMTQSSVLNVQGPRVSIAHVQAVFSMLTTTSTSYPLLASLDTARRQLALKGHRLIENTLELAEETRASINSIDGLYCAGAEMLEQNTVTAMDPTKLLISVQQLGINGYEAEKWLRKHYRIEVELSDLYNILCIISFGDTEKEISLLVQAMKDLARQHYASKTYTAPAVLKLPSIPTLSIAPRDAFYAEKETVALSESAGRIIAEFIMIYPPGIPVLLPGEIITEENLIYIQANAAAGLPVQGPEDPSLQTIRVIQEQKPIQ